VTFEPTPSTSVVDHVVNELRRAIYGQQLKPGDRLVERQLAADLGVSHIPVREALARLTEEGLVERLPRKGCRVTTITVEDLDEFASIRDLLEQFVAVRVQERLTSESEAELRQIVEAMILAAAGDDVQEVIRLDEQFHRRLWSLADHKLLSDLSGQLRSRINAFLYAATLSLSGAELTQHAASHVQLLDAIASRRVRVARAATSEHIATAMDRIRRTIEDAAATTEDGAPVGS
jgi:DNA-binding GntR family transcriptional regulator